MTTTIEDDDEPTPRTLGFGLRGEEAERFGVLLAEHRADPTAPPGPGRRGRKRPPASITRAQNLAIGHPNTGKRRRAT